MSLNILHINTSGRETNSVTRTLSQKLVSALENHPANSGTTVTNRDLLKSEIPFLNEMMITSYFTKPNERTAEQANAIALSNKYVAEVQAADVLVLGVPIYNFSVPGVLKTYFDLIARSGLTFSYGTNGPVGLLKDKKAYLVVASGGTRVNSEWDYTTGYVKHFLSFLGITDIELIIASEYSENSDEKIDALINQTAASPVPVI